MVVPLQFSWPTASRARAEPVVLGHLMLRIIAVIVVQQSLAQVSHGVLAPKRSIQCIVCDRCLMGLYDVIRQN